MSASTKQGPGVGGAILCVFLGLLAIIFGLVAGIIKIPSSLLAETSITESMEEVDLSEVTLPTTDGDEIDLAEMIYDSLGTKLQDQVSESRINDLLEEEYLRDFAGDVLSGYAGNLTGEGGSYRLNGEKIERFIRKNRSKLEKTLNTEITDEMLDNLNCDQWDDSLKEFSKSLNEVGEYTSILFSPIAFWLPMGLMILLLVCIALICRFKLPALLYVGIPVTILGLLYFGINVALGYTTRIVCSLTDLPTSIGSVINPLLSGAEKPLLTLAAIMLVAGLLAILAYIFIRLFTKPKAEA